MDLVADIGGHITPFEIKYRAQNTGLSDLKGLLDLVQQKSVTHGYIVTKSLNDFGPVANLPNTPGRLMRLPAPLLCHWLGAQSEVT